MMEGSAKFQWKVHEKKKVIFFPFQSAGPALVLRVFCHHWQTGCHTRTEGWTCFKTVMAMIPGEGRCVHAQSCPTIATPQTEICQPPLSMGFRRQEYWSGLWLPSPGDLPNPGIEPEFSALQADSLPLRHQGNRRKDSSPSYLKHWVTSPPHFQSL